MIVNIDKEINSFLLSLADHTNKEEINKIIEKYSISITETLKNGHITTNVCMVAASNLKLNPIELASKLVKKLNLLNLFETVETAGPGFINITLRREDFVSIINSINDNEEKYGESNIGNGKKIQIEFVSANPTGPLHVGHGRGAAYGDAIGRILKATGYDVQKEYYINDAGRQIDILTASVILKSISKEIGDYFPENAYKGEYINEISKKFEEKAKVTYQNLDSVLNVQKSFLDSKVDDEKEIDAVILSLKNLNMDLWDSVKKFSVKEIVDSIEKDLKKFNVSFDGGGIVGVAEDTNDIGLRAIKIKNPPEGHPLYDKVQGGVWFQLLLGGVTGHKAFAEDCGAICRPQDAVDVISALVRVYIQNGNRGNRGKARLVYLIKEWGNEKYINETNKLLGKLYYYNSFFPSKEYFNYQVNFGNKLNDMQVKNWIDILVSLIEKDKIDNYLLAPSLGYFFINKKCDSILKL